MGQQTDEIDQAIDRDINHMPPQISHLNPNRKRSNKSNGQVEISQEPTSNDYWASVTNQEYREVKEASDQIILMHCIVVSYNTKSRIIH